MAQGINTPPTLDPVTYLAEFKDIFVLVKIQLSLKNIFVRDCCKSSQNNAHYL